MKLTEEQRRMLKLLSSGVGACGEDLAFKKICQMGGQTLERVVDELSAIERQPGLAVTAWELIVKYKGWLAGKVVTEDMERAIDHATGMV